jgi:hypothetical protein
MRGPDPRIHLSSRMMDCRIKPGNDNLVAIHATVGADNGHSGRYTNAARHVRAFGVELELIK